MRINRNIIDTLRKWKESPNRKPALLMGARQTGKTWAMEEFGAKYYEYYVKFDFDKNPELKSAFQQSKDPERILKELSLFSQTPILPQKTLIIFDEIQECEEAFNALKYFCEDAHDYHIIAAGSLLGIAVKKKRMAVPVGKVTLFKMHPLSFREFLSASDNSLFQYVEALSGTEHLPEIILNKLKLEYRRYSVSGGMPEVVEALLENKGMAEVEKRLQDILNLYELDFSRYAEPTEIPRIRAIWNSLPSQLSKENRKFVYKVIRTGARSKDYEDALSWLKEAGMIHIIHCISKPGMPLSAYKETEAFKVYACDSGLLRRLAKIPAEVILNGNSIYTEFKGAMAENTILQSLINTVEEENIYYWSSGNKAEVEFVVQQGSEIIPVEVKAEDRISGRSLSVYNEKYNPSLRIRFSMQNLQKNGNLLSCPSPLSDWVWKL